MARTLFFLSAEAFQAYVWEGTDLAVARTFSNDADGREQFSNFLSRHPYPAYMLVDVIEEDFHLETVPHLTGSARKALLERKYEQYYRTTPFRQATLLQRQSEGRRDDDFLFSALTNQQRISPWLETLLARRIPLVGLYSVPNISTPLLKNIASEHVLLLSWEKNAGLRQTYFNNKRLHFSRLTPINDGGSFSASVAKETPRTQQYLKSLSLPPPGEVLDIHIICHPSDRAELEATISVNSDLHFIYIDITELARLRKCKHQFTDSDATPLFLNLLATNAPSAHYANSHHTHFYLLWQLRRILFGLAAVTTLVGVLWSGINFWQGRDYAAETDPLKEQTARVKLETSQVQSKFADTKIPAGDMKSAVLLARRLGEYAPIPRDILYPLSEVMDTFPRITLSKLAWQTSPELAAPSPYPAQIITFEGELTAFGSEHRKELEYLERFEQALVQHGYTVNVLTMPLDVSSKGSISGEAEKDHGKPAQFKLNIIWRHPS